MLVVVGKQRLEADRSRGRVDLTIDRLQCTARELTRIAAVPRGYRQGAAMHPLQQRGHVILRQREHHGDRLELRHHHQAVGLGRRDEVADVDLLQADPAVDRRDDVTVGQIELCGIDLALIGQHRADVLRDERFLRRELLLRDRILREQRLITIQVDAGIGEQRLVALQCALRLLERHLVGTWIDLNQGIARLDRLTLLEMNLHDLTTDLALHGDGGERGDGAEPDERDRHVARCGARRHDRHGPALRETPAAWLSRRVRGQQQCEQDEGEQYGHHNDRTAEPGAEGVPPRAGPC